jgi:uncharacterized protein YjbI with pentapeptide repeats
MLTIRLRRRDHTPIFSGEYRTLCDGIEDALRRGVDLDYIDLGYLDLREINLDGARLRHANFAGANLDGANLSEADFSHSCFDNASLYNACLAHSDLTGATFIDTQCGGTDVAGATLRDCTFAGATTLTLNLHDALTLAGSAFLNDRTACQMSHAPLTLQGLDHPVTLFDDCALVAGSLFPFRHGVWSPPPAIELAPALHKPCWRSDP